MIYSRPLRSDWSTSIWNEETGETWGEAYARFETFGRVFDAAEAVTLDPDTEVMSFGYGEDPEDFEGITVQELLDNLADGDTLAGLDDQWGPFAIWEAVAPEDWREKHIAAYGDEHDERCPLCGVDAQA